jgi:hypothetical protein
MAATREELEAALAGAVAPERIVSLVRRPHAYQTSHPLEEIDVELESGTRLELLAKDLDPRALLPGAPAGKPFATEPERELHAYSEILEPGQLDAPRFFGSAGSLLLLERVQGTVLWQIGDRQVWEAVAGRLGRLHERTSGRAGSGNGPLLRFDAGLYRFRLERALRHTPEVESVAAVYEQVVQDILDLPQSLIHGECYPSNVVVAGDHGAPRVAFIDWETAAIGPGLVDLAALCTGWDDAARDAMVGAYRAERPDALSDAAFERALTGCRLHLAVQWLGWAPGWSPPSEHAYDWLAEARTLAGELG